MLFHHLFIYSWLSIHHRLPASCRQVSQATGFNLSNSSLFLCDVCEDRHLKQLQSPGNYSLKRPVEDRMLLLCLLSHTHCISGYKSQRNCYIYSHVSLYLLFPLTHASLLLLLSMVLSWLSTAGGLDELMLQLQNE